MSALFQREHWRSTHADLLNSTRLLCSSQYIGDRQHSKSGRIPEERQSLGGRGLHLFGKSVTLLYGSTDT